jgi:hypothetical protein
MPSFAEFGKLLGEAGQALIKPAIPELAERGTAAAPALLEKLKTAEAPVMQRPDLPQVTSQPAVERHLEMTYDPSQSLSEGIQSFKTLLGGAIKRDPNLPKDLQQRFLAGRQAEEASQHMADFEIGKMFEPMKTNPSEQATILSKYLMASDELAQAMRDGRPDIAGEPIDNWKRVVSELQSKVDADPEIQESARRYREKMDAMFGDAQARGWLTPERYLEDYTPIRKLHGVADASSRAAGDDLRLNLLSMFQSRTGAAGERESNLIKLLRGTMAQYHRHVAESELWHDLISDKTINLTEHVPEGMEPPKGFKRFYPGPGDIGYEPKSAEESFMQGVADALPRRGNGYVMPAPVVEALQSYKRSMHTAREHQLYKVGNTIARQFTIYNPANTNVNRGSDLLVALMRAEELGASPLGILKWYGTGNKVAFRGVFGKGSTIVEINGQPVDVWEMAVEQGAPASTIMHDVGGNQIPQQLAKYLPEAQRNYDNWWQAAQAKFQMAQSMLAAERQAVELAPRIAAGLDAYEKTMDPKQFGKIADEITFHYGAGAPKWSTFPALRLIAPFIQFNGLASEWVLNTLNLGTNAGAKAKALAAMVAVPTAVMMWNSQNPEYQQVEDALHEGERNQMHIIVPDPMDPAKVRRDINGAPVVLRFRWWVPEQVAQMVGLGNTPSRVKRVLTGQDTPIKFAQEGVEQSTKSFTGMMLTPEVVKELMTGQTDTGRVMDMQERLLRLSPLARIGAEGVSAAQNYGPAEGAKVAAERWLGISFAPTSRRGTKLRPADLVDARGKLAQLKVAYQTAIRNGKPTDVKRAWDSYMKQLDEVKRLADTFDREGQPEAPAPDPRRAALIERMRGKLQEQRDEENK